MNDAVRTDESAGIERTAQRIVFMHTSGLSALFVRGQLDHFAEQGFEPHYAVGTSGPVPDVGHPTTMLPLVRQPSPWSDLRAVVATARLFRRLRPVAVHAGTPKAGLVGMIAAWATRIPVRVYAIHGFRFETATGWGRRLFRWIERVACACATDVVADSGSIREIAMDDVGVPDRKVVVLGPGSSNGVDLERFRPSEHPPADREALGLAPDTAAIGFVGRLTRDKGIDDLVRIHAALDIAPRPVLVLVGDYEDDDPVAPDTRRAITTGEDIVHVPWTDRIERIYGALDLVVFPSYREGLPNVVLEAQASGVPVVGYAATGTRDAVPDSDRLAPVGDVERLRSDIEQLLSDPAAREAAGRAGRAWVAAFDRPLVWQARAAFVAAQLERRVERR